MAIASRTSLATATRLDRLPFLDRQGTSLAFVGRVTPEKGVAEAIELARRTNVPLGMAAKVYDRLEQEHFAEVVQPAIDEGIVTFLGELTIEHHVTGFLVDEEAELAVRRVGELSRTVVRRHVIERFLPGRMVDSYEAVHRRVVAPRAGTVAERRSTAAIRALPVSALAAAGGPA
jgi:glycosyltransferase involved in cell wall biosynthesis